MVAYGGSGPVVQADEVLFHEGRLPGLYSPQIAKVPRERTFADDGQHRRRSGQGPCDGPIQEHLGNDRCGSILPWVTQPSAESASEHKVCCAAVLKLRQNLKKCRERFELKDCVPKECCGCLRTLCEIAHL